MNIIKSSLLYRAIAAVAAFFGMQWRESALITRFLREDKSRAAVESSIFARLWAFVHRALCAVYKALRLDRLLRGSVFTMPLIWCSATAALAPLLPTLAVLALALVSFVSLALVFAGDAGRKLTHSPINRYILLYAVVYSASVLTSVSVTGSLYGGAMTVLFVLFAVALQNVLQTRRALDIILALICTAGALVAAYGVYQYVFGALVSAAWVDAEMFSELGTRVYSTLDNPNVLAEYLLLVIPFSAAAVYTAKTLAGKVYFVGCFGVMCLCMVLTSSRGGWLGLLLAAAIFLVMLDRRFILLGIVGLIALYFMLPEAILARFMSIGNMEDGSSAYRLSIWLGTITMLKQYWFTGIGPGTAAFNRVYPIYSYGAAVAQHSHNLYLQIMCDAGICGIVLFLIVIFVYFRTVCSALSRCKDKRMNITLIAAVAAVAGFLAQGFTEHSFYNYRVTLMFWIILAIGVSAARLSKYSQYDNAPLDSEGSDEV